MRWGHGDDGWELELLRLLLEQWGDDAPPGLVRLSCGIEDTADLVTDITQALDRLGN